MRGNPITFDVVADDIATETRKHSDSREWARLLEDGKMLRMSHRPQWLKSDRARTGQRMKTRGVSDGTDDIYCWLEIDPARPQPGTPEYELQQNLTEG